MPAPIIFSGIQPTGRKHLGNYIGAIRQYVEGQDRGEPAIFCIVDLHAISVAYDPAELRERVYDTAAILLAAGLDPERCILFRQSDVREHTELTWLLSAVTSHGDLNRMHQFKDKSARQQRAGLGGALLLPGADGRRRARLPRHRGPGRRRPAPARRADAGDRPPLQRALRRDPGRARASDPRGRRPDHGPAGAGAEDVDHRRHRGRHRATCSTSPTAIRKKFGSAVTDSGREVRRGEDKAGITNLIDILAVARGIDQDEIEREFEGAGYGDFKKAVAEGVVELLAPVRERYAELRPDEAALEAALAAGAEKARAIAAPTLADVRERMGYRPVSQIGGNAPLRPGPG